MPPQTDPEIKIFLCTGEVSGDMIGASLAVALQKIDPRISLSGMGGGRMQKAGIRILFNSNSMGSVGISEPLVTFPAVFKSFRAIRSHIMRFRPHAAVLIGYDVYNMLLSRWLRKKGVVTINYFPPQIWLWKSIAGIIARGYDWILTSFLDEDLVYRKAGGRTIFVGHYLRDQIEPVYALRQKEARESIGIKSQKNVVGLFPGSRTHELDAMAPVLFGVVRHMMARNCDTTFVLSIADTCFEDHIRKALQEAGLNRYVHLTADSRKAMAACDLALLCSGTATLEAALMEIPMIILYQVSSSSWMVANLLEKTGLIDSKTVGLPNLLAGKRIVPEFIQSDITPRRVAEETLSILESAEKRFQIRENLKQVCAGLGERGSSRRAAQAILQKAMIKPSR